MGRPRLPAAMAPEPKPAKVVPPRRDATGVARRAFGGPTARRSYAADAMDGGKPLMPAPCRKEKLCWQHRTNDDDDDKVDTPAFKPEETGECSDV